MKITDIFKNTDRTVFSFEIFPPKKTSPLESITGTLFELCAIKPDFISVTYGAGGAMLGNNYTRMLASKIKNEYKIESMAHLTCVYSSKEYVDSELLAFKKEGIENILTLRGDINPEIERLNDFTYASDMARYISQKDSYFDLCGACYPEKHLEAKNLAEDVKHLKLKVDSGVSHLVSQLFFDNSVFYRFLEMADAAGVNVPVEAGIMPCTNKKSIERMVKMCGATLPDKFVKVMEKYEDKPEALRDAGIAYAIDQIVDLLSHGVDGIHLYTMNNPYIARRINEAIRTML